MAESYDKINESLSKMAGHLKDGQRSAEGLSLSLAKLAGAMGVGKLIEEQITNWIKKQTIYQEITEKISFTHRATLGITKLHLASIGVMISGTTELMARQREYNQSLIEAESSYENRNRLLSESLTAQAQFGFGFDQVTHAARALVHYGMDTESSFETKLETHRRW